MEKIRETGNPTVVGLDPRLNMIPEYIKEEKSIRAVRKYAGRRGGKSLFPFQPGDHSTRLYDLIPAVKPQVAMYEMYGAAGMAAYIRTIVEYARSKGTDRYRRHQAQ